MRVRALCIAMLDIRWRTSFRSNPIRWLHAERKVYRSLDQQSSRFYRAAGTPKLRASRRFFLRRWRVCTSGGADCVLSCQRPRPGDAALVASGPATLEAALYKKPMVISYQVPWLTAQIMKRQGYLPYIGLPNILAGSFIVPELLQRSATPNALADALFDQLDNDANRRALNEIFTQLHHTLKRGAAARAADAIAEVIHAARHRR